MREDVTADSVFLDVNNDQTLSSIDALLVVNGLNDPGRRRGGDNGRGDRPPEPNPTPEPEFASIDGTNNNLENPDWGSVDQALERWVDPEYIDGSSAPAGADWASPREISNIVNATPGDIANADGLSDLTWIWGQFIDHDITLSAEAHEESLDISVPVGDPFFDPEGTGDVTIGFDRSDYIDDDDAVRQQFNRISAFIDGSVIYGSDAERAEELRTLENGLLKTSEGDLLPFNVAGLENAGGTSDTLFLAGDIRANENAALAAMHTIWVREHNRVANRIAEENPELSDEQIYQRARQFVTAELQAITYNEFLPALLGESALADYRGYDPTVNPNLANVFSTAAFRFGHTMLSPELLRLNPDGSVADEGNLALQDAFFNVDALTENGIDSILLGASVQTAQEVDPFLVDDVRNFLFGPPGSGGFDLASLNIQRGRDHGLGDYNQVRIDMGLEPVTSFADISSDPEIQARLAEAYTDVDSIDAWVGMLAEDHVRGASMGITACTIIAQQFQALRDGDRFYYENVYSGSTLRDIDRTTLADVISRNSGVDFSRNQNVFFAEDVSGSSRDRDLDRRSNLQVIQSTQAPPVISPAAQDQAIDELMRFQDSSTA